MSDILIDIPDSDLKKLANFYKPHVKWVPYVYAFIKLIIRWKQSKYGHDIQVMSPNAIWEKDGTIIVLMTYNCYNVFIFTLEENCVNLKKGLTDTKRIDFSQSITFIYVHEKHIPTLKGVLENIDQEGMHVLPCNAFTIPPEGATTFTVQIPNDVYVKKLNESHVSRINSYWTHGYPGSEKYIATLIEMNGGVGIFLKSNDQLVAWIVRHCFGHLGMLHTEDDHRKKGYAALLTKILSKEIAEEGFWPFSTVLIDNKPSNGLFVKLGFTKFCRCDYIYHKYQH